MDVSIEYNYFIAPVEFGERKYQECVKWVDKRN